MKTRKEYTAQYNVLAAQLGLPTVNCLFRTLLIAKVRVEALEARLAVVPPKAAAPGHGRPAKDPHRDTVRVVPLTKGNPHRLASKDYEKWAKATTAGTVDAAVAAGVEMAYMRYAAKRGLIQLEAV